MSINIVFHFETVDGAWSDWKNWSACSVSCGGGTQARDRACDNPAPAQGGLNCSGSVMETRICNTETCPGKNIM